MTRSRISMVASLLAVALGCGSGGGSAQGSGRVTLLLKDAPGDVQAAWVTISEVTLVGDGGVVVLRDEPFTTNLLTLATDVATLVDASTVPAGTYQQLRFVITGGFLDVNGTIYASSPTYEALPAGAAVGGELQMPSYARSGLKVILPGGGLVVTPGMQTLVVDFDVSQSFGHVTGTDKWVMHPVIKATQLESTGTVNVSVALATEGPLPEELTLAQFTATLTPVAGGDVTVLPLTDRGDGTFGATFSMLAAGDYLVSLQPPVPLQLEVAPELPAPLTVAAGQTVTAPFSILAAAPVVVPGPLAY